MLFGGLWVKAGDRYATAEDLLQETFLRAWRCRGQYRGENNAAATTWLCRIAINTLVDYQRWWLAHGGGGHVDIAAFESFLHGSYEFSTKPTQEETPEEEVKAFVMRVLSTEAPSYYASAFFLREFEGLAYKEIAGILNRPIPILNAAVSRAKVKLWRHLGEILPARSRVDISTK